MIANALLITIAFLLAYGFWLMGELKFMAAYKVVLLHAYGQWIGVSAAVLFSNIFGAVLLLQRKFLLKNTGRKLAEQILAFKADDKDRRIGGLVLEVKGDFCQKVKEILDRHDRGEDFIEISLDSEYRYNPLNNDLDAYALAFNIASLLNNLFGRGKEPFWQQAYTNLVKFIILLHKIAYDYVTLFNVYECAISPPLLEQRIREAEEIIMGRHFAAVTPEVFGKRPVELASLGFKHDPGKERYLAEASKELWDELHAGGLSAEPITILDAKFADPDKLEQLYAVQRWFREDWKRIETKLRTSIVEGISVFLSLFDDNPKVKRVFCPKKECYDAKLNADGQYGKPLPSFSWLVEHGAVCSLNFPVGMNAGLAKAIPPTFCYLKPYYNDRNKSYFEQLAAGEL